MKKTNLLLPLAFLKPGLCWKAKRLCGDVTLCLFCLSSSLSNAALCRTVYLYKCRFLFICKVCSDWSVLSNCCPIVLESLLLILLKLEMCAALGVLYLFFHREDKGVSYCVVSYRIVLYYFMCYFIVSYCIVSCHVVSSRILLKKCMTAWVLSLSGNKKSKTCAIFLKPCRLQRTLKRLCLMTGPEMWLSESGALKSWRLPLMTAACISRWGERRPGSGRAWSVALKLT